MENRNRVNLVEINLAALYNGRDNAAIDDAAKDLLFRPDTYLDWDQHVYTRRFTLYGVDETRKNSRIEFGVISNIVFDDNGNPFFTFNVPESVSQLVDKITDPVIVCTVKVVKMEDGSLKVCKPKYILYAYEDYVQGERRRIEKQVFRKGSVIPNSNNGNLTTTVQSRVGSVETNETEIAPTPEVKKEAVEVDTPVEVNDVAKEYTPVETDKITPEQELEQKIEAEKAALMLKSLPPMSDFKVEMPKFQSMGSFVLC